MNITDAKIRLVSDKAEKLKAFCSITIDNEFVVRDIKVIQGTHGCFVAMPSRKLMDRCPSCGGKNHLRAAYCNECGGRLRANRMSHDDVSGRAKLHADIAHPINSACREKIQECILQAYENELQRSRQPGYVPSQDYDVYPENGEYGEESETEKEPAARIQTPMEPLEPEDDPPPQKRDSFSDGLL